MISQFILRGKFFSTEKYVLPLEDVSYVIIPKESTFQVGDESSEKIQVIENPSSK